MPLSCYLVLGATSGSLNLLQNKYPFSRCSIFSGDWFQHRMQYLIWILQTWQPLSPTNYVYILLHIKYNFWFGFLSKIHNNVSFKSHLLPFVFPYIISCCNTVFTGSNKSMILYSWICFHTRQDYALGMVWSIVKMDSSDLKNNTWCGCLY